MATKHTVSSPTVKTLVAAERGETKVVQVGQQDKLLTLNPDVVMVFAAHHSSDKRTKHTELHKLVAAGVLISAPGVEKCVDLFTTLKDEVQRRTPEGWRTALDTVKASRVKTEAKGTLPNADQMSQIAAEAASQGQLVMVSEQAETMKPGEGKKEVQMDITRKIKAPELAKEIGITTEQLYELAPLTKLKKGAYLSPEALAQAEELRKAKVAAEEEVAFDKSVVQAAIKQGDEEMAASSTVVLKETEARLEAVLTPKVQVVVAQPVETKEAPVEAPKEEEMKTDMPKGTLADQIRAIAPTIGMEVKAASLTDMVPAIMTSIRGGAQYRDLSELKEEDVRTFVGTLSTKKQWTEGGLLVEVTKTFRAKAVAQEKALNEQGKARVEGIRKAVKDTYGEAREAFLKLWRSDAWKSQEQPSMQAVQLGLAEEACISNNLTAQEALPKIQEAAKKDFDGWVLTMEEERAPRVAQAGLLSRRVNNLSPAAAQDALKELKLGTNPSFKPLLNFFVRRIQGQEVAVTPDVYRAALAMPTGVLKEVFKKAYGAMGAQQRQAAEQAEEVVALEAAKVAETRKAEIVEALKEEVVPEAPQQPVESEEVETVVEEPTVVPEPQTVTEEVVEAPKGEEVVAETITEEPKAETVKPDVEALKGLRRLNAFFKRQWAKVEAKAQQFQGWAASKEPKKPSSRKLRKEAQVILEALLKQQPDMRQSGEAALFLLDMKGKDAFSKAVLEGFGSYGPARKAAGKAVKFETNRELLWTFKLVFEFWSKRMGEAISWDGIWKAFREVSGLPGVNQGWLEEMTKPIFDRVQAETWDEDEMRVVDAIRNAKKVERKLVLNTEGGSYIAYYSYHAVLLTAKGLWGFVGWAKLPFRALVQLTGGSAWAALSAKKGERKSEAKKAMKAAWQKIQEFAWVTPKAVLSRAWTKVASVFKKKTAEQKSAKEAKVALETKGVWERALWSLKAMFTSVTEATTKVVKEAKVAPSKPIGAVVGGALLGTTAVLLGAGVLMTAAIIVVGAALGWFAKRAWTKVRGWFSKKAAPEAAEAATASA